MATPACLCFWFTRAALLLCFALILVFMLPVPRRKPQRKFYMREGAGDVDWARLNPIVHLARSVCWESKQVSWNEQKRTYNVPFTAVIIAGPLNALPDPVLFGNLHGSVVKALQSNVVVFLALSDDCDAANGTHPCLYRRRDIRPVVEALRPAAVMWDADEPAFETCPPLDAVFGTDRVRAHLRRRRAYARMVRFEVERRLTFQSVIVASTESVLLRPLNPHCTLNFEDVFFSTRDPDRFAVAPRAHAGLLFGAIAEYSRCRPALRARHASLPASWGSWFESYVANFTVSVQRREFFDVPLRPHSTVVGSGQHGGKWWLPYCDNWRACGDQGEIMSRNTCMKMFYKRYGAPALASLPCSHVTKNASYVDCCAQLGRMATLADGRRVS